MSATRRFIYDPSRATSKQREVAAEIMQDRLAPGQPLTALWSSLMSSPDLARYVAKVGAYCRFHSALTEKQREVVTLTTTYAIGFDYESRAHEKISLKVGLDEAVIAALRQGDRSALSAEWRNIADLAHAVAAGEPSADLLNVVREELGDQGTIDLVGICAYYAMLQRFSKTLIKG